MADQEKITIEITSGHCLGGEGNDVYPGHVMVAPRDLTIAQAQQKVRAGYAKIIPNAVEPGLAEKASAGPEPAINQITHRDPQAESRDPEPMAPPRSAKRRPRAGGRT